MRNCILWIASTIGFFFAITLLVFVTTNGKTQNIYTDCLIYALCALIAAKIVYGGKKDV